MGCIEIIPIGLIITVYSVTFAPNGTIMVDHPPPNLAAWVQGRRSAEGMTQVELAQTAGVGVRFVRELEAGKPTLRMDKVNQVLWLFGYALGPVATEADVATEESDARGEG